MLSASKAALASICSAWLGEEYPEEEGRPEAVDGTHVHALLAPLADVDVEPTIAFNMEDVSERAMLLFNRGARWLLAEGVDGLRSEVAYALNVLTGEVKYLGKMISRNYGEYGKLPWVPGSIDMLQPYGVPILYDWKTGIRTEYAQTQMDVLGTIVARYFNVPEVKTCLLYLDTESGQVEEVWSTLTELEFMSTESMLAEIVSRPIDKPNQGRHCHDLYCPARFTCSAVVDVAQDLVPLADVSFRHSIASPIASPEHAGWLLGVLPAVEDALAAVKKRLKAYADTNGGVVVGDQRWHRIEVSSRSVKKEALKKLEGTSFDQYVTKSVKIGDIPDDVMAELEKAGLVSRSSYVKYDWTKEKVEHGGRRKRKLRLVGKSGGPGDPGDAAGEQGAEGGKHGDG